MWKLSDFLKFYIYRNTKAGGDIYKKISNKGNNFESNNNSGNLQQVTTNTGTIINFNIKEERFPLLAMLPQDKKKDIIENMKHNVEILLSQNAEVNLENITNINHIKELDNLIEKGMLGTEEQCKYISSALPKFINENDLCQRKVILETIDLLSISSPYQKTIMVWSWVLRLITINPEKFLTIFNNLDKIRGKYKLENNMIYPPQLSFFTRYGLFTDGDVRIGVFKSNEWFNDLIAPKYPDMTFEKFKEMFPEFNSDEPTAIKGYKGHHISLIAPFHDFETNPMTKAATYLLVELGINFS